MLIILNTQLTKSSNHYAQHYNAGKKKKISPNHCLATK